MKLADEAPMQRRDDAQKRIRVVGSALDVRELPSFGFSHRSLMWWGTMGLIAIESTAFALAIVMYFYLRSHVQVWPPTTQPPVLLWGTLNTLILLASMLPGHAAKRSAEKLDRVRVQRWLIACCAFSAAFLIVRAIEFTSLNVRWDTDAYGSVVWLLLGLHTAHIATDAWDTLVLTVLMHSDRVEGKRFVDVSENSVYWYFVVLSWLPIYAVIYWAPRVH